MMYSKTFRDYNQLSNSLDKGIVQPALKDVGLLTEFDPPVDYYVEHKKEYASLIYFTDGECYIPNDTPKDTLWVISSKGDQSDRKRYQINGASVAFIPKQK